MPIGPIEIILVFIVFMVLGPRRIANFFRSLGTGVHDFVESLGRDKKDELPEEDEEK
jgi:sec-independent protein translocase protein TatA